MGARDELTERRKGDLRLAGPERRRQLDLKWTHLNRRLAPGKHSDPRPKHSYSDGYEEPQHAAQRDGPGH